MSITASVRIEGDGRVIADLNQASKSLDARGDLGDITLIMAGLALNYASSITHQDTATLWQSYVLDTSGLKSRSEVVVHIDPSVTNPRNERPVKYGPYEHNRGGQHAFFDRTVNERGDQILRGGVNRIVQSLNASWR